MTIAALFISLLVLLLIGTPIAIALGLASVGTLVFVAGENLGSAALSLNSTMGHYTLLAIPFFILSSQFLSTGGVARRLIRFAIDSVGHLRGGLAMAGVLACMFFAAVSGSSPATVAAIGSIVIGGMMRAGYTRDFATGVICNSGTLGILIPPSIVLVVYATATDTSVGRLFLAGVIPGIIAGLMLMIGIYVAARWRGMPRQPRASWSQWLQAAGESMWGLFLFVIVMGGIYGGVFTPTEAAAVAAAYGFLIALFVYRDIGPLKGRNPDTMLHGLVLVATLGSALVIGGGIDGTIEPLTALGWVAGFLALTGLLMLVRLRTLGVAGFVAATLASLKDFFIYLPSACVHEDTRQVFVEAGKTTIMLMFVIANAMLFAHVLTSERVPHAITQAIIGAGLEAWMFLIVVNILLLAAGQFMEPSAILLVMAPILFPVATELGIDPIHLGIIMVVNMEIGMVTPPVGLNLFVASGITGMPLLSVVRAALPWLGILLIFLIIVTYVPIISTWLPELLY